MPEHEQLAFPFGTPDLERRVRSFDPEASWEAATISAQSSNDLREWLCRHIEVNGPITDDQLYAAYIAAGGRRTPQRIRTARAELAFPKSGEPRVKEYKHLGTSALGNTARQWVAA